MDTTTDEESVYQYYTIIGNTDSLLTEQTEGNYAFIQNSLTNEEDENRQIMLLSLSQQEDDEESDRILNNVSIDDHDQNVLETDTEIDDDVTMPDIEFVLPSNETLDVDDESLIGFNPEIMTVKPEMNSDDTNEEVYTQQGYHKVQLEDGTYAYINSALWNSLIVSTLKDIIPSSSKGHNSGMASGKVDKKDKKFACTYMGCDKVYSTSHHLMVHVRNHTGSRPYHCLVADCGKSFATGYSLKAHLRTHTGEAPYGCNVCPKSFKTSGDLQKHTRTHTGEKPFKCPIEGCERSFTTSNIRKVHIRSHTGERPYACTYPECKKAFASATNFKNHMRIHSGEKPYKCPVAGCGKRFTEYSSLFKHNVVHKPFVPLTCEYCNQQCKHENTLKAHKQVVHKVVFAGDGTEYKLDKEPSGSFFVSSN